MGVLKRGGGGGGGGDGPKKSRVVDLGCLHQF